MRFCEECGQQVGDEAKFCGKCGTTMRPLNPPPQQMQQPQVIQQPVQAQQIQQPVQSGEKKKSKLPLFALVAVLGVALVCGGMFFLLPSKEADPIDTDYPTESPPFALSSYEDYLDLPDEDKHPMEMAMETLEMFQEFGADRDLGRSEWFEKFSFSVEYGSRDFPYQIHLNGTLLTPENEKKFDLDDLGILGEFCETYVTEMEYYEDYETYPYGDSTILYTPMIWTFFTQNYENVTNCTSKWAETAPFVLTLCENEEGDWGYYSPMAHWSQLVMIPSDPDDMAEAEEFAKNVSMVTKDMAVVNEFVKVCIISMAVIENIDYDREFITIHGDGTVELYDLGNNFAKEVHAILGTGTYPYHSTFGEENPVTLRLAKGSDGLPYVYVDENCHSIWAETLGIPHGKTA